MVGLTPAQVLAMPLAQFQIHLQGHIDANTPKDKRRARPTKAQMKAAKAALGENLKD